MTTAWDNIRDRLLPDIKNYLDVTWDDEAIDKKLWDIAVGGMAYLDSKIGTAQDYTLPGLHRSLLFDYIRYARDGASDIFENNYRHLILAAQSERRVNTYAATKNADTANDRNQPEL